MAKKEVKVPKQKVPFGFGLPDELKGPMRKGTSPPKEKKPLTIMKIKAPIAERRKGKPVPPPPPKRVKPAPRRSPTLKWNIKKR